jgi:transcriptional regulator with XRE-family HTH domain
MAVQLSFCNANAYNDDVMSTSFGDKFRKLRNSKGISLFKLSQATGTSESNLLSIEKNRRPASDEVLRKLAAVPELEISYEQLRAWQILAKATQEELKYILAELQKNQESR